MKRKQGTFSREITEVLAYYYAVAQRSDRAKVKDAGAREVRTRAPLRIVPNKATARTS